MTTTSFGPSFLSRFIGKFQNKTLRIVYRNVDSDGLLYRFFVNAYVSDSYDKTLRNIKAIIRR